MWIEVEDRDEYTVLALRGEFDTFYGGVFQEEVNSLIGAGVRRLVLDLRMVKFINSTALGAILRSSRRLEELGGDLAIARPSRFVRQVIEKVGLTRVVPVHDSVEAAGAGIERETPAAEPEEDAETTILFTLVDLERLEHFLPLDERSTTPKNPVHGHTFGGSWRGLGRMSGLDSAGVRFHWSGGATQLTPFEMAQMLAIGSDLRVKFRLPLLKRGHTEAVITIEEIEERPDGVHVGASFSEIDAVGRDAVQQYADDLTFLKGELENLPADAPSGDD